jgi:hypothetical protein
MLPLTCTRLGDRPALQPVRRDDAQVLRGPPEVLGAVALQPLGVDGDVSVDHHVVGAVAESEDVRVEPDIDVDVVGAGPERQGVPLGAELVGLLRGEHGVDLGLDRRVAHGRVEDEDVRTQVLGVAVPGGRGAGRCVGRGGGDAADQRHSGGDGRSAEQGTAGRNDGHGSP